MTESDLKIDFFSLVLYLYDFVSSYMTVPLLCPSSVDAFSTFTFCCFYPTHAGLCCLFAPFPLHVCVCVCVCVRVRACVRARVCTSEH